MANYLQDYLYSELPENYVDHFLICHAHTKLPEPSEEYEGKVCLVETEKGFKLYMCVKVYFDSESDYAWKLTEFI